MYFSKIDRKCLKCHYYKGKCLAKCPVLTKYDENSMNCEERSINFMDNTLMISILAASLFLSISIYFLAPLILGFKLKIVPK